MKGTLLNMFANPPQIIEKMKNGNHKIILIRKSVISYKLIGKTQVCL